MPSDSASLVAAQSPRAVVLDADGTLWNTRAAMEAAAAAGISAVWGPVPDEVLALAARRFRADPPGAFRRFVAGELSFAEMRRIRLRDVADVAGLPWHDTAPQAYEEAYDPAFGAALHAYADAAELLAWCSSQGVPVRILTNSAQDYTTRKVVATGLTPLVDAVCSRDCLGIGKPRPEPFLHVCERLGVAPADTLFVGDEWESDALGAADAGLVSVWLVRADGDPAGEVDPSPERRAAASARGIPVISCLADVPAFLRSGAA